MSKKILYNSLMKNSIENKDCIANWISKAHSKLRTSMSQKLKQYNLTVEQRQILLLLYGFKSMTQSEICKETLSESSNITVTLKRMEQNDYILKAKHPKDKRTTLIYPTQKAMDIEKDLKEVGVNSLDYFLEDVTEEEHDIAVSVIKKMYKKALEEELESMM
ncbi:MarR family winged helix-turn-helix transcriptional regulator [Poseidonibacter lekithochrous]|uniref:MarR family winged helix-turn-helix transcriptional regulator n=1 Tax=Poseidonibacter lekithochrous TaxID=1904463 RepID=UPI0013DBF36B|nr:MarR family transcriptional regulator [Poseidonibacter lekithochrous]